MTDRATLHASITAFGDAYDYDASYLNSLLNASEGAYAAFADAQSMGTVRWALPLDAHFVARIAIMLADDCGACGNLNVKMAIEAGVDSEVVRLAIESPDELPAALRDVHQHAASVTGAAPVDAARVERLREHLGKEAFGELAVVMTGSRIYPSLKRALGMQTRCEAVTLPR